MWKYYRGKRTVTKFNSSPHDGKAGYFRKGKLYIGDNTRVNEGSVLSMTTVLGNPATSTIYIESQIHDRVVTVISWYNSLSGLENKLSLGALSPGYLAVLEKNLHVIYEKQSRDPSFVEDVDDVGLVWRGQQGHHHTYTCWQ